MRCNFSLITLFLLTSSMPAFAVDITALTDCSIRVFKEIRQTHKWSGKAPEGCSRNVRVEKRQDGVFVTVWFVENSGQGWVSTSLSSAMGFFEIAEKKAFTKASRDITSRASRIENCLRSIISVNDPLECRDKATKLYLAGEEVGIENKRLVWLDDNGRHTAVEYTSGNTSDVVSPPADLFGGQALPPGLNLNIHIRDTD